jgi:hypothetical protein
MPIKIGNSATAQRPSTGSVTIRAIVETTSSSTTPVEYGSGAMTSTAASASTPARATRSPVWCRCIHASG